MKRALAIVAALAGPAAADEPAVVGTQPLALIGRGAGVSYERALRPHWSAVALLGVRAAAGGDYSSRTVTVGGELRWWPYRTMRGLHLAGHLGAGLTTLTDDVMATEVGSAWALSERVDLGYRVVAWRRLTLTPTLGLAVREDVDRSGRLATTARLAVVVGFEVGWRLR